MSRKLKVLAGLNILGWIIVVPLLATALLEPFVNFGDWPGGFLTDRNGGSAQLADPGNGNGNGRDADGNGNGDGNGAAGNELTPGADGIGGPGVLLDGGLPVPGAPDGQGDGNGNGNGNGKGKGNGNGGKAPPDSVYTAPMLGEVGVTGTRAAAATVHLPLRPSFPKGG